MRILLCLLLSVSITSSFAQTAGKIADSIRRARGIPGLGYVVFSSDRVIDKGVSGFRKYRSRDSIQINDRFHIGTNTFAFTSWLAGKLVESGKIQWTTTYAQLFPQQKSKMHEAFRNVSLRELLSNNAGLPPYDKVNDFANVPLTGNDVMSQRREFANWLLQQPALDANRKNKMVISVVGYGVAAAMLEKVSGMSWEKLLDQYINKPFGIDARTGWPNKISEAQPWGHWSRYGAFAPEAPNTWVKPHPGIIPAFDVNITISDYAKFLQQHLKGLRGQPAGLSKRTYELIHFGTPDYAFGWQNASLDNARISFHTGDSHLFVTHVELIPEKNIGILVVANHGESMGKGGVYNLARLLRDKYMQ